MKEILENDNKKENDFKQLEINLGSMASFRGYHEPSDILCKISSICLCMFSGRGFS